MSDAVGRALPVDGAAPEWVHLLPAGQFQGADGRGPYNADAKAIVAEFQARPKQLPLVVDFDHLTQHTAARGGHPAPAAGWIVELQARADGVWARVEWTPGGRKALANKDYRFLSPVFAHDRTQGAVTRVLGAALTNAPNLDLSPVLNAQQPSDQTAPVTIEQLVRQARDESAVNRDRLLGQPSLPRTEKDPVP